MKLRSLLRPTTLRIGIAAGLFNLVAATLVHAHWEVTFRFRPVEPWIPVAFGILGFPVGTLVMGLTHGSGMLDVGGQLVDLFKWVFILNAALWGVLASVIYRTWVALRQRQGDAIT